MALPRRKAEIKEQYPIYYNQINKAYPELKEMTQDDAKAYRKLIAAGTLQPKLKGYLKVHSSFVPHRLLLIAALNLCEPESNDLLSLYRQYKTTPTVYFELLRVGTIRPVDNAAQKLLRELFPASRTLHLYVGLYETTEPTHYINLKRIEFMGVTYFVPGIRRVNTLASATRNGVIAKFSSTSPSDAINHRVKFERIITGGVGIDLLHAEIMGSYELQRQLTHSILVGYLSDSLRAGSVAIRLNPGRLTLMPSIDDSQLLCFSGSLPFSFSFVSSRHYAPDVERFGCTIYGDAHSGDIDSVLRKPRLILPKLQAKNFTAVDSSEFEDMELWFALGTILSFGRLLPYIGVKFNHSRSIAFYSLNYDPTIKEADIVRLKNKKESYSADLPYIVSYNGAYYPNSILAAAFKMMLLTKEGSPSADSARKAAIFEVLHNLFNVTGANALRNRFDSWGFEFVGEELTRFLEVYRAMFNGDD